MFRITHLPALIVLGWMCLPAVGQANLPVTLAQPATTAAPEATTLPGSTQPAPAPGTAMQGDEQTVDRINPVRRWQEQVILEALASEWVATLADHPVRLSLADDGRYVMDHHKGHWTANDQHLTLVTYAGHTLMFDYKLEGNQLTLSGGDLIRPLTLQSKPPMRHLLRRLFHFSVQDTLDSLYRILIILGLAVVVRMVLAMVGRFNRMLIFSNHGPMRFFYREQKFRALTIHSMVLNLIKYAVYLTALGFILGELGVNLTTYLASLSVIGLAIAFGSQGLVQDTVTGFFIIFESQFDVGDMVEISGQVGVVQELGLRMTKIRNYPGQVIVIPNRNIAVVGNYARGALIANVEVSLAQPEQAPVAQELLKQCAEQLGRQFAGIMLRAPRLGEALHLDTGECFVRMHVAIWPGQQWVIEQQLTARLREVFARESIAIASDRVVVYYYPREYLSNSAVPRRWRRRQKNKDS